MDYPALGRQPFSGNDRRLLSLWGGWTIVNTPGWLPDLSDVQVIVKTSYPGQAPQIVESQVTYPLTTTMLSVPGTRTGRLLADLATPTCT
ncbi:efflux RND transporter permease subunit [Shigella flexneri]